MAEFEVELTTLVYGGDALGRLPDGRAVFVPYALPGERVRVRLVEEKRGHARAELVEILRASPDRISPRCAHFGTCGGCHYQHLSYDKQLEFKNGILREQLERIAGISPEILPIVPSPQPWHYRNAVQFSLTPEGQLGYQRAGSHSVVPIRECHLPENVVNELWPLLSFEPDSGIQRVELRSGANEDVLITLEGDDPQPPPFEVDFPVSVVHIGPAGAMVLAGDDHILMEILGRVFQVTAGAFFQVNTAQAEAMVRHILTLIPDAPLHTTLDVYCGAGLFSAFLAPKVERLVGIELSPEACADFAVNLDEFDHVELYQGLAEQILPALKIQAGLVVVDPPRSGLERPALEALLRLGAPLLIYVSCDPATLARDTRRLLEGGYRLRQITPFDMFPQTYAIESISVFVL